jgi:ATPase subunit of ABC transporter with duplicated ATPase domains
MPSWDQYPEHYRCAEVQAVLKAIQAGDSAAVIGLSGAGKSNLLGFLAHRVSAPGVKMLLVDCNRLAVPDSTHLYAALRKNLEKPIWQLTRAPRWRNAWRITLTPQIRPWRFYWIASTCF